MVSVAAVAQDFDTVYAKTEFAVKAGPEMYNGPVRPVWTEGETFLYRTQEPSGEVFYSFTDGVKTPVTKEAFEEQMNRQRSRYYDPSDESQYAVKKEVKETSPDGKWEAFVKDHNVWLRTVEEGSEARPLSFDGTEGDAYVQIRWSPDSRKIAALRKQILKERQIMLRNSRPESQVQPEYRWLDYAKPGDVLPQCTPALFDVEAGQIVLDREIPRDQYFLELGWWSPESDFFTYEYNQRGHQLYEWNAVDAATGKVRTLAREKSDTFIYYYDLWRWLSKDGKTALWISERDNWRHLYVIDTQTLSIRQLTRGEWNVREIHTVDEEGGFILANANGLKAASGEDPYDKHVVRIDLASGKVTDLTPENANHQAYFNREHTAFVDNYSRPDLPCTSVLRSAADGSVMAEIHRQDISALLKKGFTMPEVFCAKGRDGVTGIWGTIWRPYNFSPKKKYPVVEYIYAGPHDSHVDKNFMATPRWMRLTQLGFIVVCIDGMGTDNRSKSFQDVCWRNIKDAGFPDRILWMQAAARKYKYMDLSNVGIYGYSAGGQNTLAALLFHPEFYKVGVALCGCHDNRMDKIWWNEQWMGYPLGPWYSESSNVDNAWRLEGKLLIINGEMDDNVDPASSLQVVSELVKHGKDFEQLYLPGHTHNLGSDYITRRIYEFFWRNCK